MNAAGNTACLTSSFQVSLPSELNRYRCLSRMGERIVTAVLRGHTVPEAAKVRGRGQEDVVLTTGRRVQSVGSEGITGQAGAFMICQE